MSWFHIKLFNSASFGQTDFTNPTLPYIYDTVWDVQEVASYLFQTHSSCKPSRDQQLYVSEVQEVLATSKPTTPACKLCLRGKGSGEKTSVDSLNVNPNVADLIRYGKLSIECNDRDTAKVKKIDQDREMKLRRLIVK